eukprot:TRINITY_DN7505_c0_g2_i6.p1 TRINITY_DN7505_c0_g2~~TRINITY_DN7505_c0_g2_i6.p1  ORF type:complete len:172 (+),score=35.42 TRINITY_DN7505_c0_g2_i6:792-1307(+)
MGGALKVPGNVISYVGGRNSEWNAFWDPYAVKEVWEADVEIIMVPLDVTNSVPLTQNLLLSLARQRRAYPLYDLTGQVYSLVAHTEYYLWDTLTIAYFGKSEIFSIKEVHTSVHVTGKNQGSISITGSGKKISYVHEVNPFLFYQFLLQKLQHLSIQEAKCVNSNQRQYVS